MTRTELTQRLNDVAAKIPAMLIDYPDPGERLMAIAGELDAIEESATDASDARFVCRRIDSLIVAAQVF